MENIKFKEGDILMTASNRFLSKAIRAFTKTKYSHGGLVFLINDEWQVLEAQKNGIRVIAWKDYYELNSCSLMILRAKFKIDAKELKRIAIKDLGNVRYDFFGILHQALFQTTGLWIGRKGKRATKRKYCTEYVAYVYNKVHRVFPKWWSASPKRLMNYEHFEHILLF